MNGTIITNKGLQLIAKLVASGTELAFTRAAIGIGSVPQGYDPGSMIGLNQYIMDGVMSSCSASGDEASIAFQISSIGVDEGFTMTEAGLFAQDPDEGEILYAYLDMASDPQYIYPENNAISKFVEFTLVVKVGRVSSITAYINPSALVTREEFDEELKKKIDINGGDIANTKVSEFSTEEASFPVPAAGDTTKTLWGKIKKFAEDFRNWHTGVCLIGSIVNNCTSTASNLPLSAAQGKVLMDLYTQLNSDKQDTLVVETGQVVPGCVNIDEQFCFKYGKFCVVYVRCSADSAIPCGRALFTLPWNIRGAASKDLESFCVLWDGPEKDPVNASLKYWQGSRTLDLQRNIASCRSLAFHMSYLTD